MSKKLYEESNIQDIASAIRAKNGTSSTYITAQMAEAIRNIRTQPDLEELSASENGTYTPSSGKDGFSRAVVNVQPDLEELNASANGSYTPSSGKDGFSRVNVDVPSGGGSAVLVEKTITENGTYNALLDDDADGYSEVLVSVNGGGSASFDNILVGSSEPDASIGTPGDAYIQVLTNRVDGRAYQRIMAYFYKTSQNVWATTPDFTLPYLRVPLRIVTHSTDGNDASIDFYAGQTLIKNILYNTVQNTMAHSFEELFGLFVGYNTSTTPDNMYRNGWCIYAPSDSFAIYNGDTFSPNSLIESWLYVTSVNFIIEV